MSLESLRNRIKNGTTGPYHANCLAASFDAVSGIHQVPETVYQMCEAGYWEQEEKFGQVSQGEISNSEKARIVFRAALESVGGASFKGMREIRVKSVDECTNKLENLRQGGIG